MTSLIEALQNTLTPEQGQTLAWIGAFGVFFAGIAAMVVWRIEARSTRRRKASRFEPRARRIVAPEPITQELPVIPMDVEDSWASFVARHPTFGRRLQQIAREDVP